MPPIGLNCQLSHLLEMEEAGTIIKGLGQDDPLTLITAI